MPVSSTEHRDNTASDFVLSARQLGKRFNREWIFRNLSMDFSAGKRYAVVGPNGSGKSTLLQVLWGQMPPSVGTLNFQKGGKAIDAGSWYQHLCIAAPYLDLIEELTLKEHLEFHFKMRTPRSGIDVESLISIIGLEKSRDKFIGNFSSGMRQRVKLALAFYTEADVIFLDEPGTNLDTKVFDWYLNEYHKLPASSVVFIASNNPEEYPGAVELIDIMSLKKQ